MTNEEAIKKINMMDEALNFQRHDADECSQALQMAIRSLKAWEEVITELEELKQEFKNDRNIQAAIAVNISIKRIKQKLAEIK